MATTKKYTLYHKDGTVWANGSMKGKSMEGYWIWFRKDGSKLRGGNFENNKQVGIWTTYDAKGKVAKETDLTPKDAFMTGLGAPAGRALHNAGLTTLQKVSKVTEADLLKLHGIGPSAIPKLRASLKEKGLSFKKSGK